MTFTKIQRQKFQKPGFNALLNYLFPSEEDFMIVPQFKRPEKAKSIDFTTVFIIERGKKPVFFMEIKPAGHLHQPSSRRYADNQVRERADDFIADGLGIKTVYGRFCMSSRPLLAQPRIRHAHHWLHWEQQSKYMEVLPSDRTLNSGVCEVEFFASMIWIRAKLWVKPISICPTIYCHPGHSTRSPSRLQISRRSFLLHRLGNDQ